MTSPSSHDALTLAGRALIAWLFIPSGVSKLLGFSGIASYIASRGVPLPEVCAAIAVLAELGLGLLVLLGWRARQAAVALAVFVAVITPIFYHSWHLPQP